MLVRLLIAVLTVCLWAVGAQAQGLTVKNPPTYTGTALGNGYTFGGVGTTLFIPQVGAYNFTLPFSVSMWVKYPTLAVSGTPYLISSLNAAPSSVGFAIAPKVSDAADSPLLQFYMQAGTTSQTRCSGIRKLCAPIAAISDGGLHHLCAVWTASYSTLYIDGVPRAWGPSGSAMTPNTTDSWSLGSAVPSGTQEIDVAVWTRPLTAPECALIHNRGLAGKNAMSGNAPASLSTSLIGNWKLSDCAGSPTICPDSSATNNQASVDPAPSLAITVPSNGATGITGNMTITATCTDTFSVSQVVFTIDGGITPVATDTTPPYSTTFDSTLLLDANNPHTVTAVCTNQAGVTSTASNTFSTNNGVIAPRTFYLNVAANGGSDANDGLAATVGGGHGPWLTPNHNIRCGDSILAQPSQNYAPASFGLFGTVWSCPAIGATTGPFWAYLKCDLVTGIQDCYIHTTASGINGMRINKDNWSIENWHISASGFAAECARQDPVPGRTKPPGSSTFDYLNYVNPRYIRLLNNYMDSCGRAGIVNSLDYWVVVGNLAYNSAYNSSGICDSGVDSSGPFDFNPSDTGTHILVAGNFVINNGNPPGCTDGEGVIWDDWLLGSNINCTRGDGTCGYSGQALFTQNLMFGNSSFGLEVNPTGEFIGGVQVTQYISKKYFTHNTMWGNGLGGGPGNAGVVSHGQGAAEFAAIAGSSCGTGCATSVDRVYWDHNIAVSTGWSMCLTRTAPFTCPPSAQIPDFHTLKGGCTTTGPDACSFQNSWLWNTMMAMHTAVRLATAAALPANVYNNASAGVGATLTATGTGALTVDGVAVATSDRVLVKNEVDQTTNGIYVVTNTGGVGVSYVLTRASDADTILAGVPSTTNANASISPAASPTQLSYGVLVNVTAGSANANKQFMETTKSLTAFGTSLIAWGSNLNVEVRAFYPPLVNITEADPVLTAPALLNAGSAGPGGAGTVTAIDCSTSMTAYACMHAAGYDTDFQPTATGTAGFGYPIPSGSCFDGSTPEYTLDFTLWPVWVQGTLGASGTYVTLPCGW